MWISVDRREWQLQCEKTDCIRLVPSICLVTMPFPTTLQVHRSATVIFEFIIYFCLALTTPLSGALTALWMSVLTGFVPEAYSTAGKYFLNKGKKQADELLDYLTSFLYCFASRSVSPLLYFEILLMVCMCLKKIFFIMSLEVGEGK